MDRKIQWFARGGGVAKCGPFADQVAATEAIRQVTETDQEYFRFCTLHGNARPQLKGGFPPDAFTWPEVV